MSNAMLVRLDDEAADITGFIERTLTTAAEAERDLSETEVASLAASKERLAKVDEQRQALLDWEGQRASAAIIDRAARGTTSTSSSSTAVARFHTQPRDDRPTLGSGFVQSEQYRTWNGAGSSGRWTYEGSPTEIRATLTTGAAPGSALLPATPKWVAEQQGMLTPLLGAITRVPVTTGTVDVVQTGLYATGAAVVPEGTAKPEGTVSVTVTPTPLQTIAAWIQATRQLLADAPAAEAFIDSQLRRGVLRKLEDEVTAVIKAASIPTTTGAAGEKLLNVVRKGIATVASLGWQPDVLLANPSAMAQLDLSVLSLGGVTTAMLGNSYWGLQAVPVPQFADTDIYVADASAAFTLFERMGVEVFTTDSDITGAGATAASAFRQNIITILAELRAKAAVTNTTAATKLVITP